MKHTKHTKRRPSRAKRTKKTKSHTRHLTYAIIGLGIVFLAEVATIGFVQGDGLRASTYGPLPVYQDSPFVPVPSSKMTSSQCRKQARKEKWDRKELRECIKNARSQA